MRNNLIALIVLWLLLGSEAMADGQSHFQFFKNKCEVESVEKMDAAPQSPPLDVDDPDTPGCNQWEVNVVFDGDFTKDEKNLELPLLDINYGLGDNLQLKYEVPSIREQTAEKTVSGIGNSKVGVKYLFYENEEEHLKWAVYPQVKTLQGEGEKGNIISLPLLMSLEVGENHHGPILLTSNLAYNLPSEKTSTSFISAAVGMGAALSTSSNIMAEISTIQDTKTAEDAVRGQLVKANLGAMKVINKKLLIFGSVGTSLVSSDETQHLFSLAGIRWLPSGSF